MDTHEQNRNPNPRRGVNFLSVIFFRWILGTYRTGFKRELEVNDLHEPLKEHESNYLGNKLSQLWQKELERNEKSMNKCKPSLLRILLRYFGCNIILLGFALGLLEIVFRVAQPIILAYLLRYFSSQYGMEKWEALIWGTVLVFQNTLEGLMYHPIMYGLMHVGMKIRVGCCSLIYRKILRISKGSADSKTNVGQMINLLSNDVNRLDYSVLSLHYGWISPVQTALIAYLLYTEVGLASVGGVIILVLFLPLHFLYGKLVTSFTLKLTQRTDERLKLTNEIIKGIKVIKMYAWEKPFTHLINKVREKEVHVLRNSLVSAEICKSFEVYIPRICIFLTILAYVFFGNNINAEKVYLITAYYNVIRSTLYRMFPLTLKEVIEALVSIKRLQSFLLFEEISEDNTKLINHNEIPRRDSQLALTLKDVVAKWNKNAKIAAIKEANLEVKPGSLTAVIGPVGSGKTTLFHTILSEMPYWEGKMQINGKISYACQEPWIFTSSIKQNILFGQAMDRERYEKVINVCHLRRDLHLLPYGDNTLASERGANLSGGQCARVNLARAVYREADIYLLDDPLSAVDTHVSKGIFEDCIKTFLKGKTVILITHQLHLLKQMDRIVYMDAGRICADGSYAELLNSGFDLKKLMQFESEPTEISDNNNETSEGERPSAITEPTETFQKEKEDAEGKSVGNVKLETYSKYIGAAGSLAFVLFVMLVCVTAQAASTSVDYYVTYWVNVEEHGGNITYRDDDVFRGREVYIYTYGALVFFTIITTLTQSYFFFDMCMRISKNLHGWMLASIVNAKISFFNSNPVGRIMNRFSKDMGMIDTRFPPTCLDVVQITLNTISVIAIVVFVKLYFIFPITVIAGLAYLLRTFYLKTCRSIKRLEGITRSPVFNHVTATVQGLTTIRALHAESLLTREFDNHQDLHSSAWFLFFSGSRAFGLYIELLVAVFLVFVVYTLILLNETAFAGDVGLVVTQLIMLCGALQWGIRQTTEMETQMTSVERILEYADLPQEPSSDGQSEKRAPKSWPTSGQIMFSNVTLTYDRQKNPALKNLNFSIEPNEMIGIVGRTGAGKSSIISAIFRLAEFEGEIYIDNVPISTIPLRDLRSRISIIPQEPVLFAGTLRRNLDPFEEYADHDLWQALDAVELKGLLDSDLGLDMNVTEGGSNFSVGQRQLLCLARAIVRNNKVLVLDEATANVDPSTDELIQKAIRKKFADCTVFIVAHRLNTVMDSDKILVMDAGQAKEFDHPYNLLQNQDGIFFNMVQQTGTFTAKSLYDIAKWNYNKSTVLSTKL